MRYELWVEEYCMGGVIGISKAEVKVTNRGTKMQITTEIQ